MVNPVLAAWGIRSQISSFSANGCPMQPAQGLIGHLYPWGWPPPSRSSLSFYLPVCHSPEFSPISGRDGLCARLGFYHPCLFVANTVAMPGCSCGPGICGARSAASRAQQFHQSLVSKFAPLCISAFTSLLRNSIVPSLAKGKQINRDGSPTQRETTKTQEEST